MALSDLQPLGNLLERCTRCRQVIEAANNGNRFGQRRHLVANCGVLFRGRS